MLAEFISTKLFSYISCFGKYIRKNGGSSLRYKITNEGKKKKRKKKGGKMKNKKSILRV